MKIKISGDEHLDVETPEGAAFWIHVKGGQLHIQSTIGDAAKLVVNLRRAGNDPCGEYPADEVIISLHRD